MDKIKLSALIVDKEGQLTGAWATLISDIIEGVVKEERIHKDEVYLSCWRLVHELYTFMRHNKIEEFKGKLSEAYENLKVMMEKYEPPNLGKDLTLMDLKSAIFSITSVITMSGYHDDKRENMDDEDEPW
jgi:hypothetical protein